jgi:hypothetical protein
MRYYSVDQNVLHNLVGFGIAGNFAGHLEQAGETPDFVNVETATENSPKGLFPFFVPNSSRQTGTYPMSSSEIVYPKNLTEDAHLQAEPEVCVLFEVEYQDALVVNIQPQAFAAFNDCSIRKPGARKISDKKNWGEATKGLSETFIELTSFDSGCDLDSFRIASFLKRDGAIHTYGQDSQVTSYSYFHRKLQDWIVDKLNTQEDFGPLENLHQVLQQANCPQQIMVSLGATRYTEFGETVFLQPGDEVYIYVYDAAKNSEHDIESHLNGHIDTLINSSILHQRIV